MPLLAVYVTYQLEDGRFWDSLKAAWITAEEAEERALSGQSICKLANASGPADETSLISTLLFYGYALGELSENLPPDLSENLDRAATIRDIQEALTPINSGLRDLRDTTVADINATVNSIDGQEIPAIRQDILSINVILPDIQEDLLGIHGNISLINASLNDKAGKDVASQSAAGLMSANDKKKLDGIAAGAQVNPSLSAYATTSAMNTALAGYLPLAGGTVTGLLNLQNAFLKIVSTSTDYYYLVIKNPAIVKNTTPASQINVQNAWSIRDKNEQPVALCRVYDSNSGVFRLSWYTYAKSVEAAMHLEIAANGAKTLLLPDNPPAAENSVRAASTSWVRARIAAATGKGATTFSLNPEIAALALDDAGEAGQTADSCGWHVDMVTPDMLQAAIKAVNDYSSRAIFYGFSYELGGEDYFFTYDLCDQQNMADNAILALAGEPASLIARKGAGEMARLDLSPEEMLALHSHALKSHKQAYMDLALERKNELGDTGSAAALKARLAEYGLLDAYTEYMKSINSGYLNELGMI